MYKIPNPWTQLAVFLVAIFIAMVVTSVGIFAIPGFRTGKIPDDVNAIRLAQAINSVLFFGLAAYIYAYRTFKDHPLAHLGFRPAIKSNFYLVAVLLLVFSFPIETWLNIVNKRLPMTPWMVRSEAENDKIVMTILQVHHSWDWVYNLLVIAVIPAIFEEVFFRGALQRIMIQIFKRPWLGIIISAFLFSAFHMQFAGFFPRMFLGMLLGAIYWYSGSLWTNILAHFLFNGIQVVIAAWYPDQITDNPSIPFTYVIISLVIVVGLLVYMRRKSTITYALVY